MNVTFNKFSYTYKSFITHVKISERSRKTGKPRWKKINGSYLYGDSVPGPVRTKILTTVKNYLKEGLNDKDILKLKKEVENKKIKLGCSFYAPLTYGSYAITSKNEPSAFRRWDIGNQGQIWLKAFSDVLVDLNIIPDDNVKFVTGEKIEYFEVKKMSQRKLIFTIYVYI